MEGRPSALIGSLLMVVGVFAIFAGVVGIIIYFAGLDPMSFGRLGLVTIAGYPLVGEGALVMVVIGGALILIGSIVNN